MSALFAVGHFGWTQFNVPWRWAAVVLFPLIFMGIWGTFNVPGDPSRSGAAPVVVAGWLRLAIELTLLFAGAAAAGYAHQPRTGVVLGAAIVVHYALSLDRITWLLER